MTLLFLKIKNRFSQKFLVVLAGILVFIIAWRCLFLYQTAQKHYLEVIVNSKESPVFQLYYDQGYGFNEFDSTVSTSSWVRQKLWGILPWQFRLKSEKIRVYHFELPPYQILKMRLAVDGFEHPPLKIAKIALTDGLHNVLSHLEFSSITDTYPLNIQRPPVDLNIHLDLKHNYSFSLGGYVRRIFVESLILIIASILAVRLFFSENKIIDALIHYTKKFLTTQENQSWLVFLFFSSMYLWLFRSLGSKYFPILLPKILFFLLIAVSVRYVFYKGFGKILNNSIIVLLLVYSACITVSLTMNYFSLKELSGIDFISLNNFQFNGVLFDKSKAIKKLIDLEYNSDQSYFLYLLPLFLLSSLFVFSGKQDMWGKVNLIFYLCIPNLLIAIVYRNKIFHYTAPSGDENTSIRVLLLFLFALAFLAFSLSRKLWRKLFVLFCFAGIIWMINFTKGGISVFGAALFLMLFPFIVAWVHRIPLFSKRMVLVVIMVAIMGLGIIAVSLSPRCQSFAAKIIPLRVMKKSQAFLTGDYSQSRGVAARSEMMRQCIRLIERAPLGGWGPGAFQKNVQRIRYESKNKNWVSHVITNLYLLIAANYGVLFLLLFFSILICPMLAVCSVHDRIDIEEDRWTVAVVFSLTLIMMVLFNANPNLSFLHICWLFSMFLGYMAAVGVKYGYNFSLNIKWASSIFSLFLIIFVFGVYITTYGSFSYEKIRNSILSLITRERMVELSRDVSDYIDKKSTRLDNKIIHTRATPLRPQYSTYIQYLKYTSIIPDVKKKNRLICIAIDIPESSPKYFFHAFDIFYNKKIIGRYDFQSSGRKMIFFKLPPVSSNTKEIEIKARFRWAIPYHEDLRNQIVPGHMILLNRPEFKAFNVNLNLLEYTLYKDAV